MGEHVTLASGPIVHYEVTGEGPPLLQIGGGGLSKRQFALMTPVLAERFQVIDVDLPGFGDSDPSTRGGTIDGWAEDAAEFIDRLEHDRVHAHGISTGGNIVLALAARHADLVDRLVVGACFGRMDGAGRLMRTTWKAAAMHGGMRSAADCIAVAGFSRGFFDSPAAEVQLAWMRESLGRTTPETFVAAMTSLEQLDQEELLGRIQAPTLLVGGALDQMTPVDAGPAGIGLRGIHERLQESTLAVLDEQSHCYFVEEPEVSARLAADYLSGAGAVASPGLTVTH